jgi:hypothetical protein
MSDHSLFPRWQFLIKAASSIVMFFCASIVFFTIGPAVETRFFPVVGKLQILRIDELPDGKSAIYAAFRKKRNCEYIGIAWYLGSRLVSFERVPLILYRQPGDDASPNRPIGFQKAGPWEVAIPADEIRSNSFAELSHRCHAFWISTTEFYP